MTTGALIARHLHSILSPVPHSTFSFLFNTQSRLINVPGTLALQHIGATPREQDVGHMLTSLSEMFTWELNKKYQRESTLISKLKQVHRSTGANGNQNAAGLNSYTNTDFFNNNPDSNLHQHLPCFWKRDRIALYQRQKLRKQHK